MTKFTAIYNGKKISIEGKSLWDAKQKAIKELKVPKSKEGLVSVMSDKSIANQDFRFMEKGGRVFDTKIWDKVKNKYKSHAGGVSESEIITWAETISKKEVSNVGEAIKILRNKEVIKIGALDGGKKVTVIEVDEWSDKRISDYEKEFGHPHYGIGGVLLGSAIGGYAGYKIGRARPQKSGFDTEKKIASKLKKGASKVKQDLKEGAEKTKKKKLATSMAKGGSMARGGEVTIGNTTFYYLKEDGKYQVYERKLGIYLKKVGMPLKTESEAKELLDWMVSRADDDDGISEYRYAKGGSMASGGEIKGFKKYVKEGLLYHYEDNMDFYEAEEQAEEYVLDNADFIKSEFEKGTTVNDTVELIISKYDWEDEDEDEDYAEGGSMASGGKVGLSTVKAQKLKEWKEGKWIGGKRWHLYKYDGNTWVLERYKGDDLTESFNIDVENKNPSFTYEEDKMYITYSANNGGYKIPENVQVKVFAVMEMDNPKLDFGDDVYEYQIEHNEYSEDFGYAKGGSMKSGGGVGLATVKDTKDHLGVEGDAWEMLSEEEKLELRRTTYKHGMYGKASKKTASIKDTKSHFKYSDAEWDELDGEEKFRLRDMLISDRNRGAKARKELDTPKANDGWGINLKWW